MVIYTQRIPFYMSMLVNNWFHTPEDYTISSCLAIATHNNKQFDLLAQKQLIILHPLYLFHFGGRFGSDWKKFELFLSG